MHYACRFLLAHSLHRPAGEQLTITPRKTDRPPGRGLQACCAKGPEKARRAYHDGENKYDTFSSQ